jgi:hypothetical protein
LDDLNGCEFFYPSEKWLNAVAFVAVVIVNGLAGSTTLIGGKTTAQVSDANPTLITPAGYVLPFKLRQLSSA